MIKLQYFKLSEFDCRCCGKNQMNLEFLKRLDNARRVAGIPFVINSGFRCEDHNAEVGGSPTSSHMKGFAADIRAETSHQKYRINAGAIASGIQRIGVYKTFMHLDTDPDKRQEQLFPGES